MTIIEALVQLRDDLKLWVTNNLAVIEDAINNKKDFSGKYKDLSGAPSISESSTDELLVTDQYGNAVFMLDKNGVKTTEVSANKISNDADEILVTDKDGNAIVRIADDGVTTTTVSANMFENDASDLIIADDAGHTILQINNKGVKTTEVSANKIADESNELIVTDADGHTVLRVNQDGIKTTNIMSNSLSDDNSELLVVDEEGNTILQVDQKGIVTTAITVDDIGDNSSEFIIVDDNENAIFKVDNTGVEAPNLMYNKNPIGTGSLSLNRKADSNVGNFSVAEGHETEASGAASHAEGGMTKAKGAYAHAEGYDTEAAIYGHAEGLGTIAGQGSHAEGSYTNASGSWSHAEGALTESKGYQSHAEGACTIASSKSQHVQGEYNIEDVVNNPAARGKYAHIVGNGTASARSNAYTLDWQGNAWFAGDVYVGGASQDDGVADKLIKRSELGDLIGSIGGTGAGEDCAFTDDYKSAIDDYVLEVDLNGADAGDGTEGWQGYFDVDDTLSLVGVAADAKKTGDELARLNEMLGGSSVSDQIADALVEVYVQEDEPADAPVGSIWVDTDTPGLDDAEDTTAKVYLIDAGTSDISSIDLSSYKAGDVIIVTTS